VFPDEENRIKSPATSQHELLWSSVDTHTAASAASLPSGHAPSPPLGGAGEVAPACGPSGAELPGEAAGVEVGGAASAG